MPPSATRSSIRYVSLRTCPTSGSGRSLWLTSIAPSSGQVSPSRYSLPQRGQCFTPMVRFMTGGLSSSAPHDVALAKSGRSTAYLRDTLGLVRGELSVHVQWAYGNNSSQFHRSYDTDHRKSSATAGGARNGFVIES